MGKQSETTIENNARDDMWQKTGTKWGRIRHKGVSWRGAKWHAGAELTGARKRGKNRKGCAGRDTRK